jgi:SAM-dependent methyltransferase
MRNFESLTNLSIESKSYTPKDSNNCEIINHYPHKMRWTVDRGIFEYSSLLHFDFEKYFSDKCFDFVFEGFPLGVSSPMHSASELILLDLGCGSGNFISEVESLNPKIKGFGITSMLFDLAHHRDRIIVGNLADDGSKLPYVLDKIPSNSVDVVTSLLTLIHIPDGYQKNIYEETYRIMRPGAIALINTRRGNTLDTKLHEEIIFELNNAGAIVYPYKDSGRYVPGCPYELIYIEKPFVDFSKSFPKHTLFNNVLNKYILSLNSSTET